MLRAADAAATLGVRLNVILPGPETGEIHRTQRLWHELFRQIAFEAFDGTVILETADGGDHADILRGAQRARSFLRRLSGEAATGIRSSDRQASSSRLRRREEARGRISTKG